MDEVVAALDRFITAFNALDMEQFADCLSSAVSLFPPNHASGTLIEGSVAVVGHFKNVFQSEPSTGPNIKPVALRVRHLGMHAALATFQFARADGSTGRRSLTFQREETGWKIVHIHASNTQPSEPNA